MRAAAAQDVQFKLMETEFISLKAARGTTILNTGGREGSGVTVTSPDLSFFSNKPTNLHDLEAFCQEEPASKTDL